MTSFSKNIVTDFSAPTNGTSDTIPAWDSFVSFLGGLNAGDDVTLTVPAHTYQFLTAGSQAGGCHLAPGILGGLTLVINGSGATFTNSGAAPGVGGFFLGGRNMFQDNLHSARIASVAAGSSTVRLLTPGQHTRFTVGQWIIVAGMDLQGSGFPINPAFFDLVRITGKDTVTGDITVSPSLEDSYLSTWPSYNVGDASNLDYGGPATIYALDPNWDVDATFNGITFFDQNGQIYGSGKSLKFVGGGCSNTVQGMIPSTIGSMMFENFAQPNCNIEADKVVGSLNYTGGSVRRLTFQSMSVKSCTCDGLSMSEDIHGTPRRMVFENGTATGGISIGADGYGRTERITVRNSSVASVVVNAGGVIGDITNTDGYTMSGGVIRRAKASGPITIAVPGTNTFFVGSKANENASAIILSVTDDGTDTIVTTSLAGGFPNVPLSGGTRLDWRTHPCPIWNGSGNSGCADIVDLNNVGAQGKPLFSYSKRQYTGNTLPTDPTATYFQMWGQLVSLKATVSPVFTSATGLLAEILSTPSGDVLSVDRTTVLTYDPKVDLKTAGIRTITPALVSGSVGADNMGAAPGNVWFAGTQGINGSRSAAGDTGIIEIEIVAEQGISSALGAVWRLGGATI